GFPIRDYVQRVCEAKSLSGINAGHWIRIEIDVVRHEEETGQQAEAVGESGIRRDVSLACYVRGAHADLQAIIDGAIEVQAKILPAIVCTLENSLLLLGST